MDVLSHAFIPYAVLAYMGRSRRERVAAAVGGFAPDIDTLWAWTARFGADLYPLAHRGFSHTLWGAPLLAVLLWYLATRPAIQSRWRRLEGLKFERMAVLALLIGAWSHILLDILTITGTPALWPVDPTRITFGLFFFSVPYMMVFSGWAWIRLWRRKADDAFVRRMLAVVLLVLVAAGAVRWATYPRDLPEGARVTPQTLEWSWIVSHRNDTGVSVHSTFLGRPSSPLHLLEPNRTVAGDAIRACQRLDSFTGWSWRLWGLQVVNATATGDGGWNVTFRDSARMYLDATSGGGFLGRFSERPLGCRVDPGGAAHLVGRPGGFWG